jgi:hypothetical protein
MMVRALKWALTLVIVTWLLSIGLQWAGRQP